jgi:HKD family nuclease
MHVDYITQPDTQLGKVLSDMLDTDPSASRIVFVSAFVSVQTVMRVKQQVLELKENGVNVRFVLGIDLGGTSQEVLNEILKWDIDVRIVKHRIPGHTFHPKLYLFEWVDHATIIIGSNNITEGGFFGNYEGAVRVTYALPEEADAFDSACRELSRFLQPEGPVVYQLTEEFLGELIARGSVPTEAVAREGRDVAAKVIRPTSKKEEPIFGTEDFTPPPPLPAELLERLIQDVRRRRTAAKRGAKKTVTKKKAVTILPVDDQASDSLLPAAFYMTLPTLQGNNIPGEGRIPLEAIELAKEFWGWPDKYSKEISPRAGENRVYWNWRPKWRIWSVEAPDDVTIQEVRMYMYENSLDFRFYARPLVNAGGNLGDVVRIRRVAQSEAEYECVLARQGTPQYEEWIKSCSQAVRNSTRSFGYA